MSAKSAPRRPRDLITEADPAFLESIFPEVPGIGFGATLQAINWARRGMFLDWSLQVESVIIEKGIDRTKRPGRPSKPPLEGLDARRAYVLWLLAKRLCELLGQPNGARIEHRELVKVYRGLERDANVPDKHSLFSGSESGYLSSIARGRGLLEIDDMWNSPLCEKIEANFCK